MKILVFIASALLSIVVAVIPGPPLLHTTPHLVGVDRCTWGPSYWCRNLTAAASCHATKHCIQTDWIHRQLAPDNSNICQTCLDMVKQARDQLLSNETQDLIKQVFEGSCALIHFKPIVEECDKIVDNFIPDLIDTLASEMNPQAVCSVAGLCNNEDYLKSLEEEKGSPSSTLKPLGLGKDTADPCSGCSTVVNILEKKFNAMSKDEVLQSFLMMCRDGGSFADACSNIVLTYFTQIYDHIKEHFNPTEVCLFSGECSVTLFHTHDEPHKKGVQITSISNIGFVPIKNDKDDMPCDLCKQLVDHLKQLFLANTTEEEFKQVLEGLCKQTNTFADECRALVDEYYARAYEFLLKELNDTVVCAKVGLCPSGEESKNIPIVPLLPIEMADSLQIRPLPKKPVLARVPLTKSAPSIQIISNPARPLGDLGRPEDAQLPIDLLLPPYNKVMYNKQVCEFCQYFLHYVQKAITSPSTEEEIKQVMEKACNDLPTSVNATCQSFIETYEPAAVALLAQEIDPSQICPLIRACPSEEIRDVDIFMQQDTGDNSKCPLCLFAVQKLEEMVKEKKTVAYIKETLSKLCSKLKKDIAKECQDFVDVYTDELVEMLLADLNPKEVCVALKLCTDSKPAPPVLEPVYKTEIFIGEPDTNSILDNTFNGVVMDSKAFNSGGQVRNIECVLCKLIMNEIEQILKGNGGDVVKAVYNVCKVLPDAIGKECTNFIDQYGETIVNLLEEVLEPGDICPMIQLCESPHLKAMKVEIFDCPVCKAVVWAMEKILANPKVDHELKHVLEKTCRALPSRDQSKCHDIIEKYGTEIFRMIEHMADKSAICREIGICGVGNNLELESSNDRMTILF